jgi:Xaa-Pro aminopeptidase
MIELRLQHDDAAIAGLRLAAAATAAAHAAGMAATRPGRTAAQVRAAMEAPLVARGMTCAYQSIVTPHGEILHSERYDLTLAAGDLLLADVGAETAGGWAGDVTRTWPVSGKYSPTQRDAYQLVLATQKQAIAAVTPGSRYRNVHLVACQALAAGLVDLGILRGNPIELAADGVVALVFPHGVGHLLGLDVHDMEDLGDRAGYAPGRERAKQFGLRSLRLDRDLAPGMAVTIEPGFYISPAILADPELTKVAGDRLDRNRLAAFSDVRGIRIEDDVLVTPTGREVLTDAIPKAPEAVEAAVGAR